MNEESFGWVRPALDSFLVVVRERHMDEAAEAKRWDVRLGLEDFLELHPPLPAASLERTPLRRTEHGQPTADEVVGPRSGLPMPRQISATTCSLDLILQCYHAPTSNLLCLGESPDRTQPPPTHGTPDAIGGAPGPDERDSTGSGAGSKVPRSERVLAVRPIKNG